MKSELYEWQYNGVAPFYEIVHWCRGNFSLGRCWVHHETFLFKDSKDYVLFLLRWSS